jgi:azurin
VTLWVATATLLIAACSGTLVPVTAPPTPEPTEAEAEPTPEATEASESTGEVSPSPGTSAVASAGAAGEVTLEIATATGSKDYHFVPDTLSAPAGSTIKLVFNNNTDPDDEIGHNWVLVKPGQEASVLANGITAGDDRDWLDVDDPGIIAATRLIEGKQRDRITFEAPPPGTYLFVCTFPEHYDGGMQGTLTIE